MLSLAMPTYNGEKYLREQLDSIYAQTLVPDEVIVVDDCSTDNTVEILEEYKKKYGLKYYINERNLGYNKNFEKAISLCTGDVIALADQDDIWFPEKIEKSYKKLSEFPTEEPSLVSSFSSSEPSVYTNNNNLMRMGGGWKLNFSRYFSQGCTLMFNKTLKDIVIPIHPDIIYDAYIGFTASLLGNRYYIGEVLMYYRVHSNNAIAKSSEQLKEKIYRHLHSVIPFWFGYNRYKHLLVIKNKFKDRIPKEKIEYLDNILSLYEVGKLERIVRFMKIKEVPMNIRIKSSLILFVKLILRIEDNY